MNGEDGAGVPAPQPAVPPRSRAALRELSRVLRRGGGDRRRSTWVAAAIAGAGALGCAAVALGWLWHVDAAPECTVTRFLHGGVEEELVSCTRPRLPGLAPFIAEPGLRTGVVIGAAVLTVPFLMLAVQALRFGSAARERRLAGLAVAGAGRAELRRLGALEGVRDAATGVLASLPVYLVLWLALGVLPPPRGRMMPVNPWPGLLAWPAVALVLMGFAALAGAVATKPAVLTPIGAARRSPRPLTEREVLVPVAFAAALVAVLAVPIEIDRSPVLPLLICLLGGAMTVGPILASGTGRLLVRGGDPVRVLAGRRLLADPRTPGRVGNVLFGVGIAIGVEVNGVMDVLSPVGGEASDGAGSGEGFYLAGWGTALAATLVAAAVAVGSLTVGAAEQVLDSARPTAVLVALGAARSDVQAVVKRWLFAAAGAPALAGGLLAWGCVSGLLVVVHGGTAVRAALVTGVATGLLTLGVAALGAASAARLLRARIDEAMTVENLRTG